MLIFQECVLQGWLLPCNDQGQDMETSDGHGNQTNGGVEHAESSPKGAMDEDYQYAMDFQ